MPITIYHGDPNINALGGGFAQFLAERRRLEAIEHEKKVAKEARQKRTTGLISGVVGGAIAGVALAPVAAGATSATTSALLSSGITGAQIGVGLGEAFTGGGTESFQRAAGSAVAGLRRDREVAEGRAFQTERDTARFSAVQQQQLDRWSIENFGMPYAEATTAERAAVEELVRQSPQAGEYLGEGNYAFGPGAMPPGVGQPGSTLAGPPAPPGAANDPEIPGMKRKWGPAQFAAYSKLVRKREATVDNPEWEGFNNPQLREASRQALNKQFRNIRPGLVPAEPKMTFMRDGKRVDAVPGPNRLENGGALIVGSDGGFEQYIAPTKDSEALRRTPWLDPKMPKSAAEVAKKRHFDRSHYIDENGDRHVLDSKGEWEKEKPDSGDSELRKRAITLYKDLTTDEMKPDKDGKLVPTGNDVSPSAQTIADAMQVVDDALLIRKTKELVNEGEEFVMDARRGVVDDKAIKNWLVGMAEAFGQDRDGWPEYASKLSAQVKNAVLDARARGF